MRKSWCRGAGAPLSLVDLRCREVEKKKDWEADGANRDRGRDAERKDLHNPSTNRFYSFLLVALGFLSIALAVSADQTKE